MDIAEPVTVYSLSNPVEAEIIKNALHSEGIRCFLEGAQQAAETGLTAFEIRVQVSAEDADRARKFIQSHERERRTRS